MIDLETRLRNAKEGLKRIKEIDELGKEISFTINNSKINFGEKLRLINQMKVIFEEREKILNKLIEESENEMP
jgi:hypothetical protein